ncbi:MAG TPA: response regulator transcription factor, partial [Flavisolibacter sp.]|nr:response regulator transcription factor [Flavisolibacter sp.]
MEQLTIMIAEDNHLYRHGLEDILNDLPGVVVTGVAADGQELLEMVNQNPPQVVFTDIQMPVLNGIEATRILTERYPELPVLAITVYDDYWFLGQMLSAGASGYLLKDSTEDEFARAVEAVNEGRPYYCRRTLEQMKALVADPRITGLFNKVALLELSAPELTTIRLSLEDHSIKEIA